MSNLYEVLEICLQEIENGADIDTVLFRYPAYADELRPILEMSALAKSMAAPDPSTEVMRRGRANVLQQAAQMREAKQGPSRRLWSVPLRRAVISLAVIGVLFMGSTGLVHASSTTLPGDNLYPVKRTWEDALVLFTFNAQARQALEVEHENERLNELNDLFAEGRSAKVDFAGTVMSQNGNLWLVSKVPVQISSQTDLGGQTVTTGSAIHVLGFTQADGTVLAQSIQLLPAGNPLPDIDEDDLTATGQATPESPNESGGTHSDRESEDQSSAATGKEIQSSDDDSVSRKPSLNGVVDSLSGNILTLNGQTMDISAAEVIGIPRVGASAKVEGYYDANGVFVVTKIEFLSTSSDSVGDSSSDGSKDSGISDQKDSSSDDHSSNDSGGGGSDSGSGGGGND